MLLYPEKWTGPVAVWISAVGKSGLYGEEGCLARRLEGYWNPARPCVELICCTRASFLRMTSRSPKTTDASTIPVSLRPIRSATIRPCSLSESRTSCPPSLSYTTWTVRLDKCNWLVGRCRPLGCCRVFAMPRHGIRHRSRHARLSFCPCARHPRRQFPARWGKVSGRYRHAGVGRSDPLVDSWRRSALCQPSFRPPIVPRASRCSKLLRRSSRQDGTGGSQMAAQGALKSQDRGFRAAFRAEVVIACRG